MVKGGAPASFLTVPVTLAAVSEPPVNTYTPAWKLRAGLLEVPAKADTGAAAEVRSSEAVPRQNDHSHHESHDAGN